MYIQFVPFAGIYMLVREGDNIGAAGQLKALIKAVDRQEPRNPALWLQLAQPYARLAGTVTAHFMTLLCCSTALAHQC